MKKKILLMLTLAFVMAFSFGTSMEAEAKTTTITVKSANTSTAKKLDKQLKKGKKFTVKVKGSKTSSKKLLDKTNAKLQKVNKYSVKMNTKRSKTSKGYTYYTVSADNAKLYKYTIDYLTSVYTKETQFAYWEGEEKPVKAPDYEETGNWVLEREHFSKDFTYKSEWKKNFCDLSTLQQARVVTNFIMHYVPYNGYDIQVNKNGYTKSQLMKRLATKKAHGNCGDITLYQMLVFDQIGIPSYYNRSENIHHACVAFKVTNSAGKTGWLSADAGELCNVKFYDDWYLRDASSKIVKDAKTHKFNESDLNEIKVKGFDDDEVITSR